MAQALEHNDELGLPWDDWEDGRAERLVRGRDFFQTVPALSEAAENAARRLGKAVRVVPEPRVGRVFAWVQFADYEVLLGDPCPRCSSSDLRRINPQHAECGRCKASLLLVVPKRGKEGAEGGGGPPEKGEEFLRLLLGSAPPPPVNAAKLERGKLRAERAAAAMDPANGGGTLDGDAADVSQPGQRTLRPAKLERGKARSERAEAASERQPDAVAAPEDEPTEENVLQAAEERPPNVQMAKAAQPAQAPAEAGEARPADAEPRPARPRGAKGKAGRPSAAPPPASTPETQDESELRIRPGKRFFNEHAGIASAALLSENDEPLDEIRTDDECRITVTLEIVTRNMQVRGVIALASEGELSYRIVQPETFPTPRPGFYRVTVRLPPNRLTPGNYSARIGAQLIYEGEMSRLVRGDALSFEVLPSELGAPVPEAPPPSPGTGDGEQAGFIELEGSWTVQRGAKGRPGGGKGGE